MANNPNVIKNLKPFKAGKDERRNLKGRKPKLVHHINAELKAEGYEAVSNSQVLDAFQTLINLPLSKITAIANKDVLYKNEAGEIVMLSEGDNYPMLYRLAAKELIGKRGGEYLEKLLDRTFGKAIQAVNASVNLKGGITVIMEDAPGCEPIKDKD